MLPKYYERSNTRIKLMEWHKRVYVYRRIYVVAIGYFICIKQIQVSYPFASFFFSFFFLGLFNSSALCHQGRAIMSKCYRGRWERNGPYECRITSVFLPLFFTSVTNNLPVFFLKRTLNLRKKKDVTMAVVVYNDNWLFVLCDLRFIAGLVFFFSFNKVEKPQSGRLSSRRSTDIARTSVADNPARQFSKSEQ